MKEISILPISIYEFSLEDSSLIDQIFDEIKSVNYVDNVHNLLSSEMYFNEKLFSWFEECLEKVRKIYYSDSIKLEITGSWVNKTTRISKHHAHMHPNSMVSGCFYLTTHSSGNIEFMISNPWTSHFKSHLSHNMVHGLTLENRNSFLKTAIPPKRGKLLLFPSNLIHQVLPLLINEKEDRYSISFNTFPSGIFANSSGITAHLDLKVKSVKDFFTEKTGDSY